MGCLEPIGKHLTINNIVICIQVCGNINIIYINEYQHFPIPQTRHLPKSRLPQKEQTTRVGDCSQTTNKELEL